MTLHESALEAAARELSGAPFPSPRSVNRARRVVSAYRAALRVTTRDELDALPAGSVVQSDAGTIACRFDGVYGVVFGDDRPFLWDALALPALVLHIPEAAS